MTGGEFLIAEGRALKFNEANALTDDEDLPDVPAVEFGGTDAARINYLSVSQLKSAADWTNEGCLRKWYLKKVVGLEEPMRGNLELGKQVHAQLEHYAKTGQDVLGEIARAALPFMPTPGPDLHVEKSITESNKPIRGARVTADGIPLVGFIDRVTARGKRPRVTDYKTSKDPEKWAAKPEELVTTASGAGIQMVGYVVAETDEFPEAEAFEVEHLVLHTKATKAQRAAGEDAKQVVNSITPLKARGEWQRCDDLARRLRQVAKAKSLDEVEPNWNACGSFGGCHFYAQCLINEAKCKPATPEKKPMSLRDLLAKQNGKTPTAPVADPPPKLTVIQGGAANPAAFTAEPAAKFEVKTSGDSTASEPLPAVVPPDAPKSDPKLAAEPMPVPDAEKNPDTEKPKRKPRAPRVNVVADAMITQAAAQEAEAPPATPAPAWGEAPKLRLFVDCVPSTYADPLAPYIAGLVADISKAFPEVVDIRTAPKKNAEGKDHPLAFGGWKGVLAAAARVAPPPRGAYFALGVAQSEIAQVVCEALEPVCAEFVRGVR